MLSNVCFGGLFISLICLCLVGCSRRESITNDNIVLQITLLGDEQFLFSDGDKTVNEKSLGGLKKAIEKDARHYRNIAQMDCLLTLSKIFQVSNNNVGQFEELFKVLTELGIANVMVRFESSARDNEKPCSFDEALLLLQAGKHASKTPIK